MLELPRDRNYFATVEDNAGNLISIVSADTEKPMMAFLVDKLDRNRGTLVATCRQTADFVGDRSAVKISFRKASFCQSMPVASQIEEIMKLTCIGGDIKRGFSAG